MMSQSKKEFILACQANASNLLAIIQSSAALKKQFDVLTMGFGGQNEITDADISAVVPVGSLIDANELRVFIGNITGLSTDALLNNLFRMCK